MTKELTIRSAVIPPPVGGWNTKDPISQMGAEFAVELENFFPDNGTVDIRKGYTKHVLTSSVGVYTHLAELVNNAGTRYLLAFNGIGSPYDVTSAGTGTAISGGLGTQSEETYTVNYKGRLYCKGYASGLNTDMFYTDGAAATAAAFTGPSGDDKDLWRLTTYKGRLFALSISDCSMWYSNYDSGTGAMTPYDMQALFTLGGKPWYIGPFSMTGGDVSQNYLIAVSQQGEVIIFSGPNPGSIDWAIAGKYFIPQPVGRKSFFNWGTDLLVITYDGVISISSVIGGGSEYSFLTDAVSSAFSSAIAATTPAWLNLVQGIVYPKGHYLLINFYNESTPANTVQFVMNTKTRAWSKFIGQRALSWSLLNNDLYFGAKGGSGDLDGFIGLADNGYFDENPASAGAALTRTVKMRPAYNFYGSPAKIKRFLFAVPHMYQSEGMQLTMDADVDFQNVTATQTVTPDNADTSYKYYAPKVGLASIGKCASIRIDQSVTTKRFSLQAIEVFYEEGGVLR